MIRRGYATRLAGNILRRAGIRPPRVDPKKIARLLGATVLASRDASETSGMVVREGGRIIIGVNEAQPMVRQRFTIAHEIGHMLLHADEPLIVDDHGFALIGMRRDDDRSDRETEANLFAAALLMPGDWVTKEIGDLEINVEDDAEIRRLARRFGVSQQAMMYRLMQLGHYARRPSGAS